ncbi:hypothetical protein ALC53_04521 [Atta colombica]|uniref:Uncharacterized protein n=1 Tax=Atta colombica TaxID=520822 RepID=A0A195BKE0_9HYME|nr:hypothetical protein ALC53_04521 [Atta colombica]
MNDIKVCGTLVAFQLEENKLRTRQEREGTWCVRRQARRRKGGGSVEARKASKRAKMIGTRGKQEGVGNTSNAGQRIFSNEDKRAKRKKLKKEEGERWCGIEIEGTVRPFQALEAQFFPALHRSNDSTVMSSSNNDSIARNRNHNPTLNIPKSGQESMDSPGRFHISTLPPSRSRLVVDDPGCSRRQKFALSCSNSLIPERLERGRKGGRGNDEECGDTQGAAGGVELGVIRAFCMKVSTRCDIGERRSPFRPPEVVARCETNPTAIVVWGG